jgi:hypothetical protein
VWPEGLGNLIKSFASSILNPRPSGLQHNLELLFIGYGSVFSFVVGDWGKYRFII